VNSCKLFDLDKEQIVNVSDIIQVGVNILHISYTYIAFIYYKFLFSTNTNPKIDR